MAEPDLIAWTLRLSRALRDAGVPHAIAGGLAVAAHGHARATADIDLVIDATPDAIARARAAAASIGALQTKRAIARFKRIALLRVLLAPDDADEPIPVDLLLPPSALGELFARARDATLAGGAAPIVSVEDLILLKLLRASATDLADIRALAAANAIDRAYLDRVARALRITARLSKALTRAASTARARPSRGGSGRRSRR
jgi:hypothetical protein